MFDCYYSSDLKQMYEMSKKTKKKNTRALLNPSSANKRSEEGYIAW